MKESTVAVTPASENRPVEFILFFLFLIFCYFSFFLRLTSYPLLMWDESRVAVNAFEMLRNGDLIVTYYNGLPDMWNTKPPLGVWVVAISMKLFGTGELAIRLPSAIAALMTAVVIYRFVFRHLKNAWFAFFAGMVLISSVGFIGMHVARTADVDSLVVLFLTLFVTLFFDALHPSSGGLCIPQKLYKSAFFLSLAFLTKSSTALFVMPGILVFILILKKQKLFLTNYFYVSLGAATLPFLLYCLLRESQNTGYIQAMWHNDFTGRLTQTFENHSHPASYYFMNLLHHRFFYWFYLVLLSIPLLLFHNERIVRRMVLFCLLIGFSNLLVISLSRTKLDWYDAGVYPFFSVIAGIAAGTAAQKIVSGLKTQNAFNKNLVYTGFFILLFSYPCSRVLSYINIKPGEAAYVRLKYGPFMKAVYEKTGKDSVLFYDNDYNSHLLFYTYRYSGKGKPATVITSLNGLKANDRVATCTPELKNQIKKSFDTEIVAEDKYCTCYRIR